MVLYKTKDLPTMFIEVLLYIPWHFPVFLCITIKLGVMKGPIFSYLKHSFVMDETAFDF